MYILISFGFNKVVKSHVCEKDLRKKSSDEIPCVRIIVLTTMVVGQFCIVNCD